jgi:hypothetical protein
MKISVLNCNTTNKFPMNILALAIKKLQKTDYSHIALKITFDNSREVFYDCNIKGTMERSAEDFSKQYKITREYELDESYNFDTERFIKFWNIYKDVDYNLAQLVGVLLKCIGLTRYVLFGRDDKAMICTEPVILLLDYYGLVKAGDSDEYDLNSLIEVVKRLNHRVINHG